MPSVPLWVQLSSTFTAALGPASPFCPVPRCRWSWGPPGAGTAAAAANLHGAGCCATARCLPPGSGASLQLPSMAEHLKLTLQEICCFLGLGLKENSKFQAKKMLSICFCCSYVNDFIYFTLGNKYLLTQGGFFGFISKCVLTDDGIRLNLPCIFIDRSYGKNPQWFLQSESKLTLEHSYITSVKLVGCCAVMHK